MKNLFDAADVKEIKDRISRLTRTSPRQWGKMDPAQMLAHCCAPLEVATGKSSPKRTFLGKVFGSLAKPTFLSPKPFPRNSPTVKNFKVTSQRDFEVEKRRLLQLIDEFASGGDAGCSRWPHPFFGELTPQQWASFQYKHLDHHLHQFGI